MKSIKINNTNYQLEKNIDNCFNLDELLEKVTEYFDDFDYIFGDYAYGKLRLKGFNDSNSKNCRPINDISHLDEYIKNYCAYQAKYFLLKKEK